MRRALRGYRSTDYMAFPGYRLRLDDTLPGGSYHGFIAPDSTQSWEGGRGGWPGGRSEIATGPQRRPSGHSLLPGTDLSPGQGSPLNPWDKNWGGTALNELQTMSDYVYRSSAEMRPRPNASGGTNVIPGDAERATAGYAVAPGNYRGIGRFGRAPVGASTGVLRPYDPALNFRSPEPLICPTWGCGPYPWRPIPTAGTGTTSVVSQPPPPVSPGPTYLVPWTAPPQSPSPAPTVDATPADYLPSQGQVVPGMTPGTPGTPSSSPIMDWLQASSIWSAVPNGVLVGGVLLAMYAMRGKK